MEDNQLLYSFLIIKNEVAFTYLYEKYQILAKQIMLKIYRKFYFVPLELADLESTIFFSFNHSIYKYQSWQKMTFKSFVAINIEWTLINYLKKYSTKNHQIINFATSFEESYFVVKNYCGALSYQFNCQNIKLTETEKNVLNLKSQGYSNHEIVVKLALSYKQIDNAFQRVKQKLIRFYF